MVVTCYYTKEKVDKKTAYMVVFEGQKKNTYFKDEKTYQAYISEKTTKENVTYLINGVLLRNRYTKIGKQIQLKIDKWLKSYTWFEIEFTLKHFEDLLKKCTYKGLVYVLQVIENKLIEGRELYKLVKNIETSPIHIELDDGIESLINNNKFTQKGVDITRWILE